MSQGRSSLLSDTGFDSIGTKGSKGAKKGSLDTIAIVKLGGGALALIVGVFLILRSMGVFSTEPAYPKVTESQAVQEQERRDEERKKIEIETTGTVNGA